VESTPDAGVAAGCLRRRAIFRQQYFTMKIFKYWKLILALVLVFAAGATSGVVCTHVKFKRAFEGCLKREAWNAHVMKHLQTKLNLTPEQVPKVRAIVEDSSLKFKATFGKTMHEAGDVLVDSWRQMDAVLTPEQRAIHDRLSDDFRRELKKALDFELPPK
jgi:Spy/CpxP family protein refolding chaperone